MKKRTLIIFIAIVLISLVFASWYFFLKTEKCEDRECFVAHLAACERAEFLREGEWAYQYKIIGEREGNCVVDVELVFAGLERKFEPLLNKEMRCSMPLRMVDFPEEHLDYCTGPLKQEKQYLVIRDLYQYAAQNLGK